MMEFDGENKWLEDTIKRDLQKTHLFGNLFRFIDNLCAITDHLKFEKKLSRYIASGARA